MILDYEKSGPEAASFEIIDAATDSPLPMVSPYSNVFYADDELGILRMYQTDERGNFLLANEATPTIPLEDQQPFAMYDPNKVLMNPVCVAWREEKRSIRIVKKESVFS